MNKPPHRVNQLFFEPVLRRHAAAQRGLTLMHRRRVTGFVGDERQSVEVEQTFVVDVRTPDGTACGEGRGRRFDPAGLTRAVVVNVRVDGADRTELRSR